MVTADQVQVPVRLPLPTADAQCRCGAAHESLRRFAQDYVFGTSARLGGCSADVASSSTRDSFVSSPAEAGFATRASPDTSHSLWLRVRHCPKAADVKRPSLLFGDNAPRAGTSSLSVKERPIGRKSVPKRCRDQVSVDALTGMLECLLEKESSIGTKRLRANDGELSKSRQKETQAGEANSVLELEDKDTTDELSFLVNRCDIDSDEKQSTFMPYIT